LIQGVMKTQIAFISVGSNIGNRKVNCQSGIAALTALDRVLLTGISSFYETEPVDYLDQNWFVNAAVRIQTTLEPIQLLDTLKRIEKKVGRVESGIRFGPRVLDLDIILIDDRIINSDCLVIPHPRMHERRFVLKPICDIDPLIVHPILQRNVQDILGDLSGDQHQQMVTF
jgi:2-amino-4-hydroxy-6-hydroxymethyldihydropteridine diphosphokinase